MYVLKIALFDIMVQIGSAVFKFFVLDKEIISKIIGSCNLMDESEVSVMRVVHTACVCGNDFSLPCSWLTRIIYA